MAGQFPPQSREELQLRAVQEILRASAEALPLSEILSVIANICIIVFDASSSWFTLIEDGLLRTAVARGNYGEELLGNACDLAAGGSCAGGALDRPKVLEPGDIGGEDPILGPLAGTKAPVVLLPLKSAGTVLGVLGAAVAEESLRDTTFLATMAEQAAAAVEAARLREETRTWRQRLDAVFEQMTEPALIYDSQGTLALMNQAAQELFANSEIKPGDSLAEVTRKACLLDAAGRPLQADMMVAARALRGERVEYAEEPVLEADGSVRYLLASGTPLASGAGRIEGAAVIVRDITERKEMEKGRAQFLSIVSHEMRNPLTSILGLADILKRRAEQRRPLPEAPEILGNIVEDARKLDALVENLMDTSLAEAGRLPLNRQTVDLGGLVQKVVGGQRSLSPRRRFRLEIAPDVGHVPADPGRLEQVLDNLLGNAVKYSPEGGDITVEVVREPGRVVVSVADRGRGISREAMTTLFMPFHRVHRQGEENRGVGLGLFISRSIVDAHGGTMWVQSEAGRGSTFYFSLPA